MAQNWAMKKLFLHIFSECRQAPRSLWGVYLLIYLSVGFCMNEFGIWAGIAKFTYGWQVLTCYGLYMVPISISLRKMKFHEQYLWGLFAMCLLEFSGYALGSSQALGIFQEGQVIRIESNLLAELVDIKNFSLGMAIFFGLYIPGGNFLVATVHRKIFLK